MKTSRFVVAGYALLVSIGSFLAGIDLALNGWQRVIYYLAFVGLCIILIRPRLGLYLMLFLVPLQSVTIMDSGVTAVRLVGIFSFGAWLISKVRSKVNIQELFKGLSVPASLFLFVCGVSVLWSANLSQWWDSFFTFLQLVMWFFMLIELVDTPSRLRLLMSSFMFGSVVSFLIGIYRFWELGLIRAFGGYGTANAFASLAIYNIPFWFFMIVQYKDYKRVLGILGVGIAILVVGISVSRTGILLLLVLILLVLIERWSLRNKGILALGLFAVYLTISPILPWDTINYRILKLQQGQELDVTQLHSRAWFAVEAIKAFSNNPFLGQGLANAHINYYFPDFHNLFSQILVELGILGFLPLCWLWGRAWLALKRARDLALELKNKEIVLFSSFLRMTLILYFIYSFTASTDESRLLWMLFALVEISSRLAARLRKNEPVAGSEIHQSLVGRKISHALS